MGRCSCPERASCCYALRYILQGEGVQLENLSPYQLDRDVVVPDQIRTVIHTFRDRLFTDEKV